MRRKSNLLMTVIGAGLSAVGLLITTIAELKDARTAAREAAVEEIQRIKDEDGLVEASTKSE